PFTQLALSRAELLLQRPQRMRLFAELADLLAQVVELRAHRIVPGIAHRLQPRHASLQRADAALQPPDLALAPAELALLRAQPALLLPDLAHGAQDLVRAIEEGRVAHDVAAVVDREPQALAASPVHFRLQVPHRSPAVPVRDRARGHRALLD